MITHILGVIFITLVVGLGIKLWLDKTQGYYRISWPEYAVTSIGISILVAPLVIFVGWRLSISSMTTFEEYWNGWETQLTKTKTACYRDGPCSWSYQCDPYVICRSCNCDNKGNCSTCCETHYHDCPYCTEEWSYGVNTTLGHFWIDQNRFPLNPSPWRGSYIPQSVISAAGVGDPSLWLQVKARLDSGLPGPVTTPKSYTNYFLASEQTVFKQYAGDIRFFSQNNFIPSPAKDVDAPYFRNKVYLVGYHPKTLDRWNRDVSYLNGELGRRLQGDLHVVLIKNNAITQNPQKYFTALIAAWQSRKLYKRNTLAKNSILVIVGTTNDTTVAWVKAGTGMPIGNEVLIQTIERQFIGKTLNPDSIIGVTSFNNKNNTVTVSGGISYLLLSSPKFQRVSMKEYSYLKNEIRPSTGFQIFIFLFTLVVCGLLWLIPINRPDGLQYSRRY